jgi:hypothetical protein
MVTRGTKLSFRPTSRLIADKLNSSIELIFSMVIDTIHIT